MIEMDLRLSCLSGSLLLVCLARAQSPGPPQIITAVQESVTVRSDTVDQPDAATTSYRREDLVPAAPGRPGVPFSIPGFPAETASGGIKAPQYFAPGVAGDHGEPIAQYLDLNGFLIPNNLTANAHGNGYADPNLMIAPTLDGVTVDSGAFDVRYGDHAINLAVTYGLRTRLEPFFQFSTSGRDSQLALGWSPRKARVHESFAGEVLWGNGWLQRPEHRHQVRSAALREWKTGRHSISIVGIGYEGFSHLPGLIPVDRVVPGETVDERQQDFTHTELGAVSDTWNPNDGTTVRAGGFVRRYGLDLRSNFGDGLIRQSESRWVAGLDSTLVHDFDGKLRRWTFLATGGYTLEAPHGLILEHVVDLPGAPVVPGNSVPGNAAVPFMPVTRNDLTIQTGSGGGAISGRVLPPLHVYVGGRYDHLCFRNSDLMVSADSFDRCVPTASPKLSAIVGHSDHGAGLTGWLPELSISYAQAFHANDPRIGSIGMGTPGTSVGSLVIAAHEWQTVVRKQVAYGTEVRIVAARVANAGELAKLDPDTGLQENVGPAINRYLTVALTHRRSWIFWQADWSEANARDRSNGSPIPEAPRMMADTSLTLTHLPKYISAQAEFEYVKAKALGDGFTGAPLAELRLDLFRSWRDGHLQAGVQGQIMNGYSGLTTETMALPGEASAFERVVGVPGTSYASLNLRWQFR